MGIGARLELLSNPLWSNKDIQDFAGCGKDKASKIHRTAVSKHKGLCVAYPQKVKRDSVLEALGLDIQKEIENLIRLKEVEDERIKSYI